MRSILPLRLGAWLVPGVFLILVGCGGGRGPTGTVSGTVKYKGAAVAGGSVNFHHPTKGTGAQGALDDSGNFKLEGDLEVGTYKVYIQPPVPEQLPPGTAPKKVAKLDLPPKYMDLGQTQVTQEVKQGPNTVTINLE